MNRTAIDQFSRGSIATLEPETFKFQRNSYLLKTRNLISSLTPRSSIEFHEDDLQTKT